VDRLRRRRGERDCGRTTGGPAAVGPRDGGASPWHVLAAWWASRPPLSMGLLPKGSDRDDWFVRLRASHGSPPPAPSPTALSSSGWHRWRPAFRHVEGCPEGQLFVSWKVARMCTEHVGSVEQAPHALSPRSLFGRLAWAARLLKARRERRRQGVRTATGGGAECAARATRGPSAGEQVEGPPWLARSRTNQCSRSESLGRRPIGSEGHNAYQAASTCHGEAPPSRGPAAVGPPVVRPQHPRPAFSPMNAGREEA